MIILIIRLIGAFIRRWAHCLWHTFPLSAVRHRECSLVTCDKDKKAWIIKLYCECGKEFGEFKFQQKG